MRSSSKENLAKGSKHLQDHGLHQTHEQESVQQHFRLPLGLVAEVRQHLNRQRRRELNRHLSSESEATLSSKNTDEQANETAFTEKGAED
jgi:hypothetical protein